MSYEIADEPAPSESLGNLVFEPNAPLLAAMLCGAWLAWPWFILNAYAMGSPTRRREIQLVLAAVAGSVLMGFGVYALVDLGVIESRAALQVALLGIVGFKLGMAYYVATVQARTFHVYSYYGGTARNAYYVIVAGMQLSGYVVGASDNPLWQVIVSGVPW